MAVENTYLLIGKRRFDECGVHRVRVKTRRRCTDGPAVADLPVQFPRFAPNA